MRIYHILSLLLKGIQVVFRLLQDVKCCYEYSRTSDGHRPPFFLGIYIAVHLLGYKLFEYLPLVETVMQLCKVVVPITYIPASSASEFLLLCDPHQKLIFSFLLILATLMSICK